MHVIPAANVVRLVCTACMSNAQMAGMMTRCMMMCRDCADMCVMASCMMSRGSEYAKQMCEICADACDACAMECEKHASKMEECKMCAEACRACAKECRNMMTDKERNKENRKVTSIYLFYIPFYFHSLFLSDEYIKI